MTYAVIRLRRFVVICCTRRSGPCGFAVGIEGAADGLAHAILSAFSVIDFQLVVIDGWLPKSIRHTLVEACQSKMATLDRSGLVDPDIREGTIGPHARALGAASLPLSRRFMISLPDA